MTLQRQTDGSVRIAGLDDWHLEALRSIPQLALPGEDERALRRVFPAPYAAGDASVEQQEDWAEYVQPELEALFEGSLARVSADLKTAHLAEPAPRHKAGRGESPGEDQEPEWVINVPADHVEDWFRAMNQARLVLSSTYEAHRQDQDYVAGMIARGDLEVLVQYEMLTALCGWWVDVLLNHP
jgi:hypothetical protein